MSNVDTYAEVLARSAGAAVGTIVFDDGDQNFQVVDTIGFRSVSFILACFSITGAANIFLEESDDNSNYTPVPVDQIRGRAATAGATAGLVGTITNGNNKIVHFGVKTKSRYYRLRQGSSSAASGIGAAYALLSNPYRSPVAIVAW